MNMETTVTSILSQGLPTLQKSALVQSATAITYAHPITDDKPNSTVALLNRLFPEQNHEEKIVRQTRALLGGLIDHYSTEELEQIIIQVQCLTEAWLDAYERNVFEGLTLNELLNKG